MKLKVFKCKEGICFSTQKQLLLTENFLKNTFSTFKQIQFLLITKKNIKDIKNKTLLEFKTLKGFLKKLTNLFLLIEIKTNS